MSELNKFEALQKKLGNICDEHNLCYRFRKDTYPITLTISPCGGVNAQMTMLEVADDEGYRSPDATIVFYSKDGDLCYKLSEQFTISDALFSKIRNLYRKMMAYWCQHFFRYCIERNLLAADKMPQLPDDGEDLPEGAEPIEEVDPDNEELEEPLESVEDEGDQEENLSGNELAKNDIIEFAKTGGHLTSSKVSSLLGTTMAGASRLLTEMEEEGLIRRNPITTYYELVADESFDTQEDGSNA